MWTRHTDHELIKCPGAGIQILRGAGCCIEVPNVLGYSPFEMACAGGGIDAIKDTFHSGVLAGAMLGNDLGYNKGRLLLFFLPCVKMQLFLHVDLF